MKFNKPVQEVIRSRTSVRTYDGRGLSPDDRQFIKECLETVQGPFNATIRLQYIGGLEMPEDQREKLGTYGVIRGTKDFIAAVVKPKEKNCLEQLGYMLEEVILHANSRRIGTCWMGGTFKRGKFAEVVRLGQEELLPVVTPVGYPRDNRSLIDRMMRMAAGSANRKEWGSLFFQDNFEKSLKREETGKYAEALEMLRLAPSASNKQPWRVVKDERGFHFVLQQAKAYGAALGFEIQRVDIGIAMCHFGLTVEEQSLAGRWKVLPHPGFPLPEGAVYVSSWIW